MKKLFAIFIISAFAACGGNTTSDAASATPHDTSNAVTPPMPDTARILKDTNHVMGDTTNPKNDSMLR